MADRISRHDSDSISWAQVLQLAGLSSSESVEIKTEKAVQEPVKQISPAVSVVSNAIVPENKIKVVQSKAVEVKFRPLDEDRTPQSSLSSEARPSTALVPSNKTPSKEIVVSDAKEKEIPPDAHQDDSSSSLRGPVSPGRLEKPRPAKTTSIVDETVNKSATPQSPRPVTLPSPSPVTRSSSAAIDPLSAARSIFTSIDHNGDGIVSHIELIKALRGNPQLAKVNISFMYDSRLS